MKENVGLDQLFSLGEFVDDVVVLVDSLGLRSLLAQKDCLFHHASQEIVSDKGRDTGNNVSITYNNFRNSLRNSRHFSLCP